MADARKIIGVICALLFIASAITALFAFNIEWRAFDPVSYKQAFENQNLYGRMPKILAQALFTSIAEDTNAEPYLRELTVNEWQAVVAAILPPEAIKTLTNDALDSTFEYLNGKTESATISLVPLKQNLAGAGGAQAMILILRAQPDCTADQLLQIGFGFLGGKIILCNVPPELTDMLTPLLETQLQAMSSVFPNEFKLLQESADDPRIRLNQIRAFLRITPIAALFFLFCLSIVVIRDIRDWFQWWGWSFFITGILSTLLAWIGAPTFAVLARNLLQQQGADFIPPILFSTFGETINAVTSQILKPVVMEGLIFGMIGLSMAVLGIILANRESQRAYRR